tara:strand:- start:70 stop:399 length:330 start_codon:yes stop_codon:yes gene_type:complete
MSNYNWCHGPDCHAYTTHSRVRGSKGNKVLRTIKINVSGRYPQGIWKYFCNQNCLYGYLSKHAEAIVALAPRREALETKIKDPEKTTHSYGYGHSWNSWNIEKKVVDNT